jgi:hypothetical protein
MIQSKGNIWPIQADTTGRDDFDFFITANGKYGIYYSDIDEYGMMKFVSPVQIWTDKENPRLLFQSKELQFEYQHGSSCYWLDKSDILVLLAPCPHQTHSDLLYILVDFNRKVFSTINAPNFRLTEIDKNLVRLDLDFRYSYDEDTKEKISKDNGRLIELNLLKWYDIKEIDTCNFVSKNNR